MGLALLVNTQMGRSLQVECLCCLAQGSPSSVPHAHQRQAAIFQLKFFHLPAAKSRSELQQAQKKTLE